LLRSEIKVVLMGNVKQGFQPLAGQARTGEPIFTHDKDVPQDVQIIDIVDTLKPDYQLVPLGTAYPGYVSPNDGSTLYENFVLVDTEIINRQYIRRIYQALAGSWLYTFKLNEKTGDVWPTKRRKNVSANIAPSASIIAATSPSAWAANTSYAQGAVIQPSSPNTFQYIALNNGTSGGTAPTWGTTPYQNTADNGIQWMCVPLGAMVSATEREDINTFMAWEVDIIIPQSVFNSFSNAQISYEDGSYAFPARVNVEAAYLLNAAGATPSPGMIYSRPEATNVLFKIFEFWVISNTEPSFGSGGIPNIDTILPNTFTLFGINYNNVLNDIAVGSVTGTIKTFYYTIPSSTPSYTEYVGTIAYAVCVWTNGSATVAVSGVNANTAFQVGQTIMMFTGPNSTVIYTITAIATDGSNFTINAVFAGTTQTINTPYVTPGSGWIGSYKTVPNGTSIVPDKYDLLYKVRICQVKMI